MRSLYATYVTRELVRQGRFSPKLVMQLLGHTQPNVALKHYTRVVEQDLATTTFDPFPRGETGIPAGTAGKQKDAESVETAS